MSAAASVQVRHCIAVLLVSVLFTTPLVAQPQLGRAKELYVAAAYEEALALFSKPPDGENVAEYLEYQVLCLFALDRPVEARAAIENLLLARPRYQPEPALMAPRLQARFETTRAAIIRARYSEAKSTFDAKQYPAASAQFERVVQMLAGAPEDENRRDLTVLASGFRDLAGALAVERSVPSTLPGPQPSAAAAVRAVDDGIYDASARNVVAPVPLKPILPPVSREKLDPAPSPGLFDVVIDEKGRVESVVVKRSINPRYDAVVVRAARGWQYRPATRDGRPVKFRKTVEIYSTSLDSIRRR